MNRTDVFRYSKGSLPYAMLALSSLCCAQRPDVVKGNWVATWASSAMQGKPDRAFDQQTVREVAHISLGGSHVRIQLSNFFGDQPLALKDVHVALRDSGSVIHESSDRHVLFAGKDDVVIPVGESVESDPIDLKLPDFADLAVSFFVPARTGRITFHDTQHETAYIIAGDVSGAKILVNPSTVKSNFFLTRVSVERKTQDAAVIALGASITEGYNAKDNTNHRWPDLLAQRISEHHLHVAVLNQGISGNRLMANGSGLSAAARFDHDVLAEPSAHWVIFSDDPINDLSSGNPPSARDLITAISGLIARAHARNMKFICSTLTPFEGARNWKAAVEPAREDVNAFIKSPESGCDAVLDQDMATHDPQHPTQYLPAYDSGDHLHPNDAGMKAIADALDLKVFK